MSRFTDWEHLLHMAGHGRRGRGFGFGGGPPGGHGPPPGGGFPPGFPPGMPWPLWQFFRRRQRARRGDVRTAILARLAEEARNGYQIMRELEQRSRGAWRPSPGSVYPALQQLEDEGLVRAEPESSGGGRVFRLTDKGRKYVNEHADEMSAPWETAGPGGEENDYGIFAVMAQLKHIASAAMQLAQTGQARQVKEAHKILAEARRQLYGLLASDEPPEDE